MSAEINTNDWMQQLVGVDIWLPRVVCANAKSAPIFCAVPFSAPNTLHKKNTLNKASVLNKENFLTQEVVSNKKIEIQSLEKKLALEQSQKSANQSTKLSVEKSVIQPTAKTDVLVDAPVFKIHILIRALTPRWLLLAEASSDDAEFSDAEYETIFNLQRALESDPSVQPVFQQSWLSWPPNIGFSSPAEAQQWFAPDQLKAALRGLLKNRSWSSYTHLLVLGDRLSKILTEQDVETEAIVINNPRKTLIAYRTIATLIKQPSYRKRLWETIKPLRE